MDQHLVQGWHADPFGLHEQRYFSAGRPTKLVRDGLIEAYDEPPAFEQSRDFAAAATSVPAAENRAAGYPAASYAGVQGRKRRMGRVNAAVALIAAAAVVTFVAVEGGFSQKHGATASGSGLPGTNLAAFVTKSARSTLARKTADIRIRGTVSVDGTSAHVQGSGQADFSADTVRLRVSTQAAGRVLVEQEIVTSQALYLQVSFDGQDMAQFLGGKHWIEVPLAGQPSASTMQGSPTSSLEVLEQQGAKVTLMGTQNIGGRACTEYTVTPSEQAIVAAAQQEWAKLGLSSSDKAAAQQDLQNSPPLTFTIWLDPKTDLTCQLAVDMQFTTGPSAASGSAPSTVGALMLMTFTHYGVPVDIAAPPQSDTISF